MKLIDVAKKSALVAVGAAGLSLGAQQAHAIPVDLELSLVIDVSGSVDATEYGLQMDGYANAFRDAGVQAAILDMSGGKFGAIAVNAVFFATSASEEIGFTLLDSAMAIDTFADTLDMFARPGTVGGSTAVGAGLAAAFPTFGDETGGTANGYESTRQVIDLSGDGTTNTGISTSGARDAALAAGVDTINGIAIEFASVETFYIDNVIGGTNPFTKFASGFDTFEAAVRDKLELEIVGGPTAATPEPVSATLGAMGLGALSFATRRRRKA